LPSATGTNFTRPRIWQRASQSKPANFLECFQWGAEPDPQNVRDELADVLTYCLHFASRIGADPQQIILEKLEKTRKKYPVEKAKGSSKKSNER